MTERAQIDNHSRAVKSPPATKRPLRGQVLSLVIAVFLLAGACYGGGQGEDTFDIVNEEVAGWSSVAWELGRGISPPSVANPVSASGNGATRSGSIYRQYSVLQFNVSNLTGALHYVDHVGVGQPGSGATIEMQCGESSRRRGGVSDPRFTAQDLWVEFSRTHWIEVFAGSRCPFGTYERSSVFQYWYNNTYQFGCTWPITDYNVSYYTIFRYNPTWWISLPNHVQECRVTWSSGSAPKATKFKSGLESNDTQGLMMRHVGQTAAQYSLSERPFDSGQPWHTKSYSSLGEGGSSHMHVVKNSSGHKNGLHFCIAYPTSSDADCH